MTKGPPADSGRSATSAAGLGAPAHRHGSAGRRQRDRTFCRGQRWQLVNELAARWKADRVSLGFLQGAVMCVWPPSATPKNSRAKCAWCRISKPPWKNASIRMWRLCFPAAQDATYVARATGDAFAHHGPMSIASFPLRRRRSRGRADAGMPGREQPIMLEEIEVMRLTSDLITSRMIDLYRNDKWIAAKIRHPSVRDGLAGSWGPKTPGPKSSRF